MLKSKQNIQSFLAAGATRGREGFTLIEILVVIGLIAVLAAVVIIAINPARQFAQARNSQRTSNVNAILNAIGQNMADNKGVFTCGAGALPAAATNMSNVVGDYNVRSCLVPTYMSELPYDPSTGSGWDGTNFNSKYSVAQDVNGRVTISAPDTDVPPATVDISITR